MLFFDFQNETEELEVKFRRHRNADEDKLKYSEVFKDQ